jgi:hypothetical protein
VAIESCSLSINPLYLLNVVLPQNGGTATLIAIPQYMSGSYRASPSWTSWWRSSKPSFISMSRP